MIRGSGIQGKGAFATRRIRKGTWIVEYTGARITHEVADRIYNDGSTHTFLFTVDEHTVIDATEGGGDARFINHSCDPNCDAWNAEGEIWIVASRDIEAGEELTYDYGLSWAGESEVEAFTRYACRCGAASCQGTMLVRGKVRGEVKRGERGERGEAWGFPLMEPGAGSRSSRKRGAGSGTSRGSGEVAAR
ncbi:MAG: SET domain-containing protein-lysine N-methyltransferase [Gemmatimonadales bacterium]|nr:SET domain-containing protein-lysine N-methyltransferase [Gemmatimonadales bacterium]